MGKLNAFRKKKQLRKLSFQNIAALAMMINHKFQQF